MTNCVQGVQGSVQGSCAGSSTYAPWPVQGVQGCAYTGARVQKNSYLYNLLFSPARIYPPCTPCTPCTGRVNSYVKMCRVLFARMHTLHTTLFSKKMKKKESLIICGPDNVKNFNQRLKSGFPEFFDLVKVLHKEGMIDGLRGATIESIEAGQLGTTTEKAAPLPPETKHCRQCLSFIVDTIGDGYSGRCRINVRPGHSKWAGTNACEEFKESE